MEIIKKYQSMEMEQHQEIIYINDIVDGIIKCCEYTMKNENGYEILNLGNSNATRRCRQNLYRCIKSKKTNRIGYETKVSFKQGIQNFVTWYKNN